MTQDPGTNEPEGNLNNFRQIVHFLIFWFVDILSSRGHKGQTRALTMCLRTILFSISEALTWLMDETHLFWQAYDL